MKFLLASDGSDYSLEAARQCGEIARGLKNVTVKIVTVSDFAVDFDGSEFLSATEFADTLHEERSARAKLVISATREILDTVAGDYQIEEAILEGSAKEQLLNEMDEWQPEIVFVGTHGKGAWSRMLIGSVSDALVHNAPCSVYVARKL